MIYAEAREELARHEQRAISVITWAEVLVGARDEADEQAVRAYLSTFDVVDVDRDVAEAGVRLRREHRLRLPDAEGLPGRRSGRPTSLLPLTVRPPPPRPPRQIRGRRL
jgi:hypothetical protein